MLRVAELPGNIQRVRQGDQDRRICHPPKRTRNRERARSASTRARENDEARRTLVFGLDLRDALDARAELGLGLAQLRVRVGEVGELLRVPRARGRAGDGEAASAGRRWADGTSSRCLRTSASWGTSRSAMLMAWGWAGLAMVNCRGYALIWLSDSVNPSLPR